MEKQKKQRKEQSEDMMGENLVKRFTEELKKNYKPPKKTDKPVGPFDVNTLSVLRAARKARSEFSEIEMILFEDQLREKGIDTQSKFLNFLSEKTRKIEVDKTMKRARKKSSERRMSM